MYNNFAFLVFEGVAFNNFSINAGIFYKKESKSFSSPSFLKLSTIKFNMFKPENYSNRDKKSSN